jgi:signal transduction histidine kinase
MAQAELATLFKKFASNRNAPNRSSGIGLGLVLVHTVISRHDGIIICDSIEGSGSTFTITLPLHEDLIVPQPATVLVGTGIAL